MLRKHVGYVVTAAICAVAATRVWLCPEAGALNTPNPTTARAIYREITAQEAAVREQAARSFPGDAWSADDDFHNAERRIAQVVATAHGVDLPTVLYVIDEGLHAGWPPGGVVPPLATVPPCHPRPDY